MKKAIRNFWRDEQGLTVVEYAVAGGLIALVVILAFQQLGQTVGGVIKAIDGKISGAEGG